MARWMLPTPPLATREAAGAPRAGRTTTGAIARRTGAQRVRPPRPCRPPLPPGSGGRRRDRPPRASRGCSAHLPPRPAARRGRPTSPPPRPEPRGGQDPRLFPTPSRPRAAVGVCPVLPRPLRATLGASLQPGGAPEGRGEPLPLRPGCLGTGQGWWR